MADTSYFDKFSSAFGKIPGIAMPFLSSENNPAIETLKGLPSATLEYLESLERDNTIPLTMKDQIGQRIGNIIPDFVDFGLDTGENIKTSIDEFLSGDSATVAGLKDRTISEDSVDLTGLDLVQVLGDNLQTDMLPEEFKMVRPGQSNISDPTGSGRIKARPGTMGEFEITGKKLEPYDPTGGIQTIDPELQSEAFGDLEFELEKEKQREIDAVNFRKQEEKLTQGGLNSMTIAESDMINAESAELDEKSSKENQAQEDKKVIEDGFSSAMKDFMAASGRDLPSKNESRSDSIARYKKEFEEITGIDASGKVDKSNFLMAMGLNLMQNKAGKDFNFSKIMDSGAKAVEDAMPMLTKAADKAEAASLAAGKFALGEIKAGESASAAFAKEVRTNNFNWALKKMELEEKANIEKIKSKGESNKLEDAAPFKIGAGDMEVRIGNVNGVSKFVSGPVDAGKIVNAYSKYTEGQENVSVMGDALSLIANQKNPAGSILADRAKSLGVAWGVVDGKDMFGEKGISDEAEFKKYRQATINAFKKLILQESQISNLDLTTLFASFGEVSFMQNPKEAEAAIDLMGQYFAAKKRSLEFVLTDFYDRSWYRSDEDYKRTQKILAKLSGTSTTQATTGEGGRLTLDLTSIPKLNVED